ncbi:hypothetical protein CCU68_17215 [Pseudomonas gingeri NCPPB 3146 = LMG 5327]|uniref:Uncharacterized protein n=1 Tax=Pseudomonas gingeri NCPPB 3146 = LMG 5327 TaxID=707248 RepID=A0ABX4Y369_9PSED|nr:hypothetical protein CCU68_17215 [Pseudomonas gingeri NCPPB 3146 = LMG 5327]
MGAGLPAKRPVRAPEASRASPLPQPHYYRFHNDPSQGTPCFPPHLGFILSQLTTETFHLA